jgi:SAM-dependent methyltransferase
MDSAEIRQLATLEDRHWWYAERRAIIARELRQLPSPGLALDIGAAAAGNTGVLRAHGWRAVAIDYSHTATELGRDRGMLTMRGDARSLPLESGSLGLVTALDVLEHVDEDYLAAAEIHRVLKPGGTTIISVPCDMALWSAHDEAVGHVRRYTRSSLADVLLKGGLRIERMWSWNVLLRPVVRLRRRSLAGSDLTKIPRFVNASLRSVVVAERFLPTASLPGVSLFVRARRDE